MSDALQNYLNLVGGLTRATRERATAVARALLAQAGLTDVANDASERVAKLAEEIMNAGRANRELLQQLVAAEVERVVGRLGLARAEDVTALASEVAELRSRLERAGADAAAGAPPTGRRPAKTSRTRPAPAAAAGESATPSEGDTEAAARKATTSTRPTRSPRSSSTAKRPARKTSGTQSSAAADPAADA